MGEFDLREAIKKEYGTLDIVRSANDLPPPRVVCAFIFLKHVDHFKTERTNSLKERLYVSKIINHDYKRHT